MKRIGIIAVVAALSGCGWYTNVPAQVSVVNIEPATVQVAIEGTKVTFTNPTVTVQGQNGSIGTTFGTATVSYDKDSGIASKSMAMSLRVEPTYLKKYPTESSTTTDVEFTPGSGKALLPVVDQSVVDALKTKRSITATVTLLGLDDAQFPTSVTLYVPIVSTGQ
ncbi:MAG TPA: hypothetical protein V6D05_12080 [Stenomitos sp.]